MINLDNYHSEYGPKHSALQKQWRKTPPSPKQLESFFLNELCENVSHYFLALSGLFLDAIQQMNLDQQVHSIGIVSRRLISASNEVLDSADPELAEHFYKVLSGFRELCLRLLAHEFSDTEDVESVQSFRRQCLAIVALSIDDLPMANLIDKCDWELTCTNSDCPKPGKQLTCPDCGEYVVPIYHFG